MLRSIRKHKVFSLILVVFLSAGVVVGGGEVARMLVGAIDPTAEKSCFSKNMAFAEDSPLTKEEQTVFSQNDIVFYEPCTAGGDNNNSLSGTVSISGTTAEEKVWSGLTSFMSDEQAAGVMGNMVGESGLGPTRHQGSGNGFTGSIWDKGSGKGLGLIQWDGGRRPAMANYVKSRDESLVKYLEEGSTYGGLSGDQFIEKVGHAEANKLYQVEIEFLKQELDKSYKELYDKESPDDASDYFAIHVERCAACKESLRNGENMSNRRQRANEIYGRQSGKGSPISNGVSSSTAGAESSEVTSSLHDKAWELADQPTKPDSYKGPTDAYLKAQEEAKCPGDCYNHGQACTHYVATVVRTSGVDEEFPYGYVSDQEDYMIAHPETYTRIDGDASKEETYQPGDIRVKISGGIRKHIEIYGQREGKGYILSASQDERWAGYQDFFADSGVEYHIYRTQGTPKCITNEGGCAQNSMDVVGTAICLSHPLGTKHKVRAYHGGHPTDNFKEALDIVFKGHGKTQWGVGASCDKGASTVVRYSGVDKKFPGGLDGMIPLAKKGGNKKWQVIHSSSAKDLQPGDLALRTTHVWVYLGKVDGKHYGAQAHYKKNNGEYLAIEEGVSRFNWILRPKNAQNTTQITKEMLKNAGEDTAIGEESDEDSVSEEAKNEATGGALGQKDLNASATDLAWPLDTKKSKYKYPKGNWRDDGKYWKSLGRSGHNKGADAVEFFWTVLRHAGAATGDDIDNYDVFDAEQKFFKDNSDEWEDKGALNKDEYQAGDVLIYDVEGGGKQVAFYVNDNDKKAIALAETGKTFGHLDSNVPQATQVWHYTGQVEEEEKPKDNCDRCGNGEGDDASGTGLKEGGMTLEEARAWMEAYKKEASKKIPGGFQTDHVFQGAFINYTTSGIYCKDGALNNCVGFSQWFLNKCTSIKGAPKWKRTSSGSGMVSRLSEYGFKTGNEPRPYAIFSTSSYNHTGVVMGVKGDNVIVCEAGCDPGYVKGSPDNEWPGCRSWSKSTTKAKGMTYAYTDDKMTQACFSVGGGGGSSW